MLKNKLKTLILLSSLSALLMFAGYYFGGNFGLELSIIIALTINIISYFYSDKIILKIYDAQILDKNNFKNVYNIVGELSSKLNLPNPKLWLIDTKMANAFATGRSPNTASVAITSGILEILDERELRAVLSHELSHIKNRDILITTIAATLATAIGYIANMLQYVSIWGMNSSEKRKGNNNPLALLVLAILMPIAATLIQLAISRSREYLADETGAECSHDPLALASALEKIHFNVKHEHFETNNAVKATTASLFIVNPFINVDWASLFSTHPPIHKRIAKLKQIYENLVTN